MKKLTMIAAGIGLAVSAVPSVAQPGRWVPISQRVGNLDTRIDQGLRSGSLNRAEALRLRGQLRDLQGLEARYRRGGLQSPSAAISTGGSINSARACMRESTIFAIVADLA
ncbi:hypothetical protein ACM61V_00980 [Sphingomonas sp. TX0543]|uniref:hypothetical protein n=1 Tax=Sphingomonas sp. TX0543 TaxID=3399682 RepID=UPI003AFAC058